MEVIPEHMGTLWHCEIAMYLYSRDHEPYYDGVHRKFLEKFQLIADAHRIIKTQNL